MAHSLIVYIGSITLVYFLIKFILWVYSYFIYSSTSVKKYYQKGKWAIITGATAGIGEGFCEQLASEGVNLFLVSRSEEKLKTFCNELSGKKIQTKYSVVDFSKVTANMYDDFKEQVKDLDVSILVNNVGVNTEIPEYFIDTQSQDIDNIININIRACLDVTKIVLPGMKERKLGLILNLSSFTGCLPQPLMSLYSASKAFMNSWSIALKGELSNDGIEVLSLVPMFVKSNMSKFKYSSWNVPSAIDFAKKTLNSVGNSFNSFELSPWWSHSMIHYFLSLIPEMFRNKFFRGNMEKTKKKLSEKK